MMGERETPAGRSCLHEHPSFQFPVIYEESRQSRGQMTFTHSYQRKISADRDFCISSVYAPRTPSRPCVILCVQVCVCCWVKRTLSGSSGRRSTAAAAPRVRVCFCGNSRPSVCGVISTLKSRCMAHMTKSNRLFKRTGRMWDMSFRYEMNHLLSIRILRRSKL